MHGKELISRIKPTLPYLTLQYLTQKLIIRIKIVLLYSQDFALSDMLLYCAGPTTADRISILHYPIPHISDPHSQTPRLETNSELML